MSGAALASVPLVGVVQPATVVADTTFEGAAYSSVWWRARQLRAVYWPLFARSSLAQPATVVSGTTVDGAGLACVRFFGVGIASHYFVWHK